MKTDIKSRTAQSFNDWVISPESLLQRALMNGLISRGESEDRLFQDAAKSVAEDIRSTWSVGDGFGSSDTTYAIQQMLREAGVHADFRHGRLTRLGDKDAPSYATYILTNPGQGIDSDRLDIQLVAERGFFRYHGPKGWKGPVGDTPEMAFDRANNSLTADGWTLKSTRLSSHTYLCDPAKHKWAVRKDAEEPPPAGSSEEPGKPKYPPGPKVAFHNPISIGSIDTVAGLKEAMKDLIRKNDEPAQKPVWKQVLEWSITYTPIHNFSTDAELLSHIKRLCKDYMNRDRRGDSRVSDAWMTVIEALDHQK